MELKIKTPAKINLTLEVINKREDGFHNINSIMQTVNLYDILTFKVEPAQNNNINLSGSSISIPYDEKNIVYKAIKLFQEHTNLALHKIDVFIEKQIPIEAGLAGGSSNAAGTLFALNHIFNNPLTKKELHELCSKLGSDLNVCLEGGCLLATGRGEKITKLPFVEFPVSLIKPKNLGISAKEGYVKYAALKNKPQIYNSNEMIERLTNNQNIEDLLHNDLEVAVFNDYQELQAIKTVNPKSIMSGSGSTYFILNDKITSPSNDFLVIENLKTISTGVEIIEQF